jgi:hypothetical protein
MYANGINYFQLTAPYEERFEPAFVHSDHRFVVTMEFQLL